MTPEWFEAARATYGDRQRAAALAVRDGSRLLGVLPLVVTGRRPRALRFAGFAFGDRFHPASLPADERRVAHAAGAWLRGQARFPRTLVADNADDAMGWFAALAEGAGLVGRDGVLRAAPVIEAAHGSYATFLSGRSAKLRQGLGRKLRGLERTGTVVLRRTGSAAELPGDLDRLFALHDLRWDERGGSSLAGERARGFQRTLAAAALERGWLRLWFLEVDATPRAAVYGWRLGHRTSFYLSGLDAARARHSEGLLLLAHTIREALDEGATEYDLLLGDQGYKLRLATGDRPVQTKLATAPVSSARLLVAADALARRAAARLPETTRARLHASAGPLVRRLPSARPR